MARKILKKRKRTMSRKMQKLKTQSFRNGKVLEKHHVIPLSRGGPVTGSNVILVQRRYHQSWHHLFGNLTPAEAILHVLRVWNVGSIIDELTVESISRMTGGRVYGIEEQQQVD